MKLGFYDAEEARRHVEDRRAAQKKKKRKPMPLRYVTRACIPGEIISRAIRALRFPMAPIGPELVKWFEPRIERLSGISPLGRLQRWQLAAMIWLSESREDEFDTIEDWPRSEGAELAAYLWMQDHPLETQGQISADQRADCDKCPSWLQDDPTTFPDPRSHTDRGVR